MKIHKITCIRIAIILFAVMTVSGCFVGLGPPPLVSGSQVVVDYKNTNASDFVSIPSHANVAIRETSPPTIVIKSPKVSRSLKIIEKNSTISVVERENRSLPGAA